MTCVAEAQAEAHHLEQVSKARLSARPLNMVALWEAERALASWAEERRLERAADRYPTLSA